MLKWGSGWRISEHALIPYPALVPLLWLMLGSGVVGVCTLGIASPLSALIGGLVSGAFLTLFLPGRWTVRLSLLALGLALASLHTWAPWRSYEQHLMGRDAHVELQVIVAADRLLEDAELSALGKESRLPMVIQQLRLGPDLPWQPCRGTVLARIEAPDLQYGQTLLVTGTLVTPWDDALPGGFDYQRLLASRGIHHLLYVDSHEVAVAQPQGWRRLTARLYQAREATLKRLLRHIQGDENRQVLAAMTLGFRQGFTHDQRDIYLRSGMIHLFAISGLHVGVLFLVLSTLLLAMRVPFTTRHWLGPILLLGYVLATGAAPSAMRAWLMISIWAIGRGMKIPVVSVNSVLIAAIILLITNPFHLFQMGFQFSFTIVLSLLWGWGQSRHFIAYIREKTVWRATRSHWLVNGFPRRCLQALFSMTIAWLGGLGLTAYYNQLFLPISILTNIVVMLQAWLIIVLSAVKLILSLIMPWGLEWLAAVLLEWLLSSLRLVATIASSHGGVSRMQMPPLWMIITYYALLLAFFMAGSRLKRAWLTGCVLALFTATMVTLNLWPSRQPSIDVLVPSGELMPVIVIWPTLTPTRPVLINTGNRHFGGALAQWLRSRGVEQLSAVVLLDSIQAANGGLDRLLESHRTGTLHLLTDTRRDIDRLEDLAYDNNAQWHLDYRLPTVASGPLTLTRHQESGILETNCHWQEPGAKPVAFTIRIQKHIGLTITSQSQTHDLLPANWHQWLRLSPDSDTLHHQW